MGKDGNAKKILEQCRFGVTVIENVYASDDNPLKRGIYVRTKRIRAAMNSGIFLELTDGEGEFWTTPIEAVRIVSAQLAERDAEIAERGIAIASLKAELADSQSDVAQLLTTVEQQRQYIERLRQQVAELQAWKGAVPVVGIKRLFRDAPYDASYADEVWQWIEKYTLNR